MTTAISSRIWSEEAPPTTFDVPGFWTSTWNGIVRLVKGPIASSAPNAARDSLLLDAAVALRRGRTGEASALLAPHATALARDVAYLNLVGAACELRHEWKLARRFYGVAMSVDPTYPPAQQNMRRLYELYAFGHTREPVSLGDSDIRRNRTVCVSHDNQ